VVRDGADRDILTVDLTNLEVAEFLATPADEFLPDLSPDGQWLAYVSDQSGQPEVWVRPVAEAGPPRLVSDGGGTEPAWARNGQELYYRSSSGMLVAVPVQAGPGFATGRPREMFSLEGLETQSDLGRRWDTGRAPGQFIMVEDAEDSRSALTVNVVQNFFTELESLVPTD